MKITRIRTHNFRQHRDIDLDLSSEQADLVVLKGRNGAGKTNLLNAITWCVYGDVDDKVSRNNQLLSDTVVHEMSEGEFADSEVTIELELDSKRAFIVRKQSFKKNGETAVAFGDANVTVQVMNSVSSGFEVEQNPQVWIERNLPQRFRPYFLFDGEQLERFFKESDAPRIRSAIQEVAQIDTLQRMQDMLSIVSAELIQKAAKLSGADGEKLSDAHSEKEAEISRLEDDIRKFELGYRESEASEADFDKQLSSTKDIEANINRKREIDQLLVTKEAQLQELKSEFNTRLRMLAPAALMRGALIELGEHIETARREQVLPPPIGVDYLRELLEKGECICGSDLSQGNSHHQLIEKLVSDFKSIDAIGNALNEHVTTYKVELSKIPERQQLVETINDSIVEKVNDIRDLRTEQSDLARLLEGQNDEVIAMLASHRREAREMAVRFRLNLDTAKSRLEIVKQERAELVKKIEKATAANNNASQARKKAEFAKLAASCASTLYEEMNSEIREKVSATLEEFFKSMTWKEDFFKSVNIDEEFRVSVLNNRDIEILDRLAAGERLCLAFAFSLTLSQEAGLNFPIIVDTPMGRLAPEVQENLASVIAKSTQNTHNGKNHQIILLMTETEYNQKVADVFSSRRPKVMEIIFDTKTAESKVI